MQPVAAPQFEWMAQSEPKGAIEIDCYTIACVFAPAIIQFTRVCFSCATFDGTSWSLCKSPTLNISVSNVIVTCNCDITASAIALAAVEAVIDCTGVTGGAKVIDACGKCGGAVTDAKLCSAAAAAPAANAANDAAIIGGVIGGLLFLGLLILAYQWLEHQKKLRADQDAQTKLAVAAAAPARLASADYFSVPMQPLPPIDTGFNNQWANQLSLLQQLQALSASPSATQSLPMQQTNVSAPSSPHLALSSAVRGGSYVLRDSGTITSTPSFSNSSQVGAAPLQLSTMPTAASAAAQGDQQAIQKLAAMQQLLQLQIMQQQFQEQQQQPSPPSSSHPGFQRVAR
jgi:hypothetical protein